MTDTARKLIGDLEDALERLPDGEQEERVASYLNDLQQRKQEERTEEDPYSALKILRDAKLPGPEDASVTYEEKLYGLHDAKEDE